MKVKVGDAVRNEVLKSKKPKTQIAKELHKSRTWLDNVLRDELMDIKHILGIGSVLEIDFSPIIPGLKKAAMNHLVNEPSTAYAALGTADLRAQLIDTQAKYIKLMEEHIKVLHELKGTKG